MGWKNWIAAGTAVVGAAVGGMLAGPTTSFTVAGITLATGTLAGVLQGAGLGAMVGMMFDSISGEDNREAQEPSNYDLSNTYTQDYTYPVLTVQEGTPIPRAYGRVRLAGNIIRSNDPDDPTNVDVLVGHCQGPIDSILTHWINNLGRSEFFGTGHAHVYYTGTTTQVYSTYFADAKNGMYRGLAYSALRIANGDEVRSVSNINAALRAMKCLDIGQDAGGTTSWTRNPAQLLWDWYINVEGYDASDLHLIQFQELEAYCSEIPSNAEAVPVAPPGVDTNVVKATNTYASNTRLGPFALRTDVPQTGTSDFRSWMSASGTVGACRINIDFGVPYACSQVVLENYHASGADVSSGVSGFVVQASNSAASLADVTYAGTGWTLLSATTHVAIAHPATDTEDPQTFTFTNTTPYRYYSIKVQDNCGGGSYVGLRHAKFYAKNQRYTFDYVFDTNVGVNDAKKLIWKSFNGSVIMSQGKLKPVWESGSLTYAVTEVNDETSVQWGPTYHGLSLADGQAFIGFNPGIVNSNFVEFTGTANDATTDAFTNWVNAYVDDVAGASVLAWTLSGTICAKLTGILFTAVATYQIVSVVPGISYAFKFEAYGDGTNSGLYEIYDWTHSVDIVVPTSFAYTAEAWMEKSFTFTAPAGCTQIALCLYSPLAAGASYTYYKNVRIAYSDIDLSNYAGVEGSSTPYLLVLHDSAGKKATGYIGAADAAEALGSENCPTSCCTDPADDQNNTTGWSAGNSAALSSVDNGLGGKCLRITENGAAVPYATMTFAVNSTPGDLIKLTYKVRAGTETHYNVNVWWFPNALGGLPDIVQHEAAAGWTTVTQYLTALSTFSNVIIYLVQYAGNGDATYLDFDDVSVKEVTHVGATGVHIVSLKNGSTRNWAEIESGFKYNDTAYTFEVMQFTATTHTFNVDNIVKGSFRWGKVLHPNVVRIGYVNSRLGFLKDTVEIKDEREISAKGEILFDDTCYFITETDVATRRARFKFEKAHLTDYVCQLTGFPDSQTVEIYDKVTVSHPGPGWSAKEFLVRAKSEDEYGRPVFQLEAYYSGIYHDRGFESSLTYGSHLPNPFRPPPAIVTSGVTVSNVSAGNVNSFGGINISFTPPNDPSYSYTEIYLSTDDATFYLAGTSEGNTDANIAGMGVYYQPGDTVYVRLRPVNALGVAAPFPSSSGASVVAMGFIRLSSFYFGNYDYWAGHKDVTNVATKFVLGGLDGTPKMALGAGADHLTLDNSGTCPGFYVDGDGNMRIGGTNYMKFDATTGGLDISGGVTASYGSIGGWKIGSTYLWNASGTTGLRLDAENSRIRSNNYVSGAAGAGFSLDSDLLEVGNVKVRGSIRSVVFQKDVISAVGGNVLIRPADVVATDMSTVESDCSLLKEDGGGLLLETSDNILLDGYSVLVINGDETFAVGDILRVKDGIDDEWMKVTIATSGSSSYYVARGMNEDYTTLAASHLLKEDQEELLLETGDYLQLDGVFGYVTTVPGWTKGSAVVNYGQGGSGGIYMTSSDVDAPYLSVFSHSGAPWSSLTTRLRIGNLNNFLGYVSDEYGIAVGDNFGYLKYDPTNGLRIRGNMSITNGGLIASAVQLQSGYIRTSVDYPYLEMSPDGLQLKDSDNGGTYETAVYGTDEYGAGALVWLFNTGYQIPWYEMKEPTKGGDDVASFHFYDRDADPAGGTYSQGELAMVSGLIKVYRSGAWYEVAGIHSTEVISTGAGTVKMASGNPGTNAGWIQIGIGKYVPYWTDATP